MAAKNRVCPCGQVVPPGPCPCAQKRKAAHLKQIDVKRPSAGERGYDADWRAVRRQYLAAHPACQHEGCTARAVEVDHIQSIRDAPALRLRWSNLRGYCAEHHRGRTMRDQVSMSSEYAERARPSDLRPSRVPLTIVCGPAGSGKSSYVADRAGPNDIIIDLDVIRADLAGTAIHQPNPDYTRAALERRNGMLRALARDREHDRAWFIVSAPTRSERMWWKQQLGAERVVVMDTPLAECKRRILRDYRRVGQRDRMVRLAEDWFAKAGKRVEGE